MNDTADYKLLDFGWGRKLESLSGYVIDRPSPAAESFVPAVPDLWNHADAHFDEVRQAWQFDSPWPDSLSLLHETYELPLRPTPFGHIGAFPEQRPHWVWLSEQVRKIAGQLPAAELIQSLNLFAYTGGSTLALASSGAAVTHVDAAKPSVTAARQSARSSGMEDAPIRYIVDDAAKYCAREVRRKRRYRIIVLDPPSYGHSPDGKAWRLDRDLWPMLSSIVSLFDDGPGVMLFTGHSSGGEQDEVQARLLRHPRFGSKASGLQMESGRSSILSETGRTLDAGFFLRATWTG